MSNCPEKLNSLVGFKQLGQQARKSFFVYFIVYFFVASWIHLPILHSIRMDYLAFLNQSATQIQDWSASILFYDYKVHLKPNDPKAWFSLARSYELNHDMVQADRAYKKAQQLQRPGNVAP